MSNQSKEVLTFQFMLAEIKRLEDREENIQKLRTENVRILLLTITAMLVGANAMFKGSIGYSHNYFLIAVACLFAMIPLSIMFNYFRLLANMFDISIVRVKKFIALKHFEDFKLTAKNYRPFDIYKSMRIKTELSNYIVKDQYNALKKHSNFIFFGLIIFINFTIIIPSIVTLIAVIRDTILIDNPKTLESIEYSSHYFWAFGLGCLCIIVFIINLFKIKENLENRISQILGPELSKFNVIENLDPLS